MNLEYDTDPKAAPVEPEDDPVKAEADTKLLERVHDFFTLVCDAEADQRRREREDLLFQIAENQWTDEAKRERQGTDFSPARLPVNDGV